MSLTDFAAQYATLSAHEQGQFTQAVRRLFNDGFLWRDDEADRSLYYFVQKQTSLLASYLDVAGWQLVGDERLRLFHLTHREGAHRRRLTLETTRWLLILRLFHAEQREKATLQLAHYPTVTVLELYRRREELMRAPIRKKSSLEEALRTLSALKLIRAATGGALRADNPDQLIELLPILELIIPATSIAALHERLQSYAGATLMRPATLNVDALEDFLHNWHRLHHHIIPVRDSLYFAGHNGSGKSSILDALQVVLIGDLTKVRFNSAAQTEERSIRNLDSYVRGKVGESGYLRPGASIAYIALEFTDTTNTKECRTVGVCIEAADKQAERTFFILKSALDVDFLVPQGHPRPRRELKQVLRQSKGGRGYDQVHDYQNDLRNVLGGLHERFFDLFVRALTFTPIRNIRDFVEQWLLEAQPLDIAPLQKVVEQLDGLRAEADRVTQQLTALTSVTAQQQELARLHRLHLLNTLRALWHWLQHAEQQAAASQRQFEQIQTHLMQVRQQQETTAATRAGAQDALNVARLHLDDSDTVRQQRLLQAQVNTRQALWQSRQQAWHRVLQELRASAQARASLHSPPWLTPAESSTLSEFGAHLQADLPGPTDALVDASAAAATTFTEVSDRLRPQHYAVQQSLRAQQQERDERRQILRRLEKEGRFTFPDAIETFRNRLESLFGQRPPLLCELLEITDLLWQDAVEAMLGQRRFNVIVRPEQYGAALDALEQARAEEQLYEVGLVNLEHASREARRARPETLATVVSVKNNSSLLRNYIDNVLGDIVMAATVAELPRYRRAVTAAVLYYGDYTARAIDPKNTARPSLVPRLCTRKLPATGRKSPTLIQASPH